MGGGRHRGGRPGPAVGWQAQGSVPGALARRRGRERDQQQRGRGRRRRRRRGGAREARQEGEGGRRRGRGPWRGAPVAAAPAETGASQQEVVAPPAGAQGRCHGHPEVSGRDGRGWLPRPCPCSGCSGSGQPCGRCCRSGAAPCRGGRQGRTPRAAGAGRPRHGAGGRNHLVLAAGWPAREPRPAAQPTGERRWAAGARAHAGRRWGGRGWGRRPVGRGPRRTRSFGQPGGRQRKGAGRQRRGGRQGGARRGRGGAWARGGRRHQLAPAAALLAVRGAARDPAGAARAHAARGAARDSAPACRPPGPHAGGAAAAGR